MKSIITYFVAVFCIVAVNSCMFFSKPAGKGQSSTDEKIPIRGVAPPYTTDPGHTTSQPRPATPTSYPQATAIPGRPGYVYSPYSRRVIDVVNIAAGTLVNEPQSPLCAKKFFYVP